MGRIWDYNTGVSMGGHNQGLPARSSVKTVHRTVFRALRTPNQIPPTPLPLALLPRPAGPLFGEIVPLAQSPGPHSPRRKIRKVRIFAPAEVGAFSFPQRSFCSAKMLLAPAKPLLRIYMEGLRGPGGRASGSSSPSNGPAGPGQGPSKPPWSLIVQSCFFAALLFCL